MIESWLPASTRLPASRSAAIDAVVDTWSRRWFGTTQFKPSGVFAFSRDRAGDDALAWLGPGGMAIGVAAEGKAVLASLALNISAPVAAWSSEDQALADTVAQECLDNLRHDLETELGNATKMVASDAKRTRPWQLDFACRTRGVRLRLALTQDCFSSVLKQSMPSPKTRKLDDAAAALAAVTVDVSALLGRCSLALDDIAALAPGDVVKLGTPIASPLPLTLNDRPMVRGKAALVQQDDVLALKLVEAPCD